MAAIEISKECPKMYIPTTMQENLRITRWVNLDHKIRLRDVKTPGGNIGSQKNRRGVGVSKGSKILDTGLRWMLSVERN